MHTPQTRKHEGSSHSNPASKEKKDAGRADREAQPERRKEGKSDSSRDTFETTEPHPRTAKSERNAARK